MHPRLTLIGKVQIALSIEGQVVEPFEALRIAAGQVRGHLPGLDIQPHQPIFIICDEQLSLRQELHSIGFAVVFDNLCPCSFCVNPKHPTKNNIRDVEITHRIKHGALKE